MSWQVIKALIGKDLKLFSRDKFYGVMSIFVFVMYLVFYIIMPSKVEETIKIGFFAPEAPNIFFDKIEKEGVIIRNLKSQEELEQAITNKEIHLAISIPQGIQKFLKSQKKNPIYIYYPSDLPGEFREMYDIFIGEMVNQMSGLGINIKNLEIVLGPDMGGKQIPLKNRMIPLFAFMLIITETMGLANLITTEVESGMIPPLMVTKMSVVDLFVGKGITGVFLAFVPTVLIMALTGALSRNSSLIIVTLLLGSMMITGISFFIASISKDMMAVGGWAVILMVCLMLPGMVLIFPGPVSGWVKMIPSFYIVDTLYRAVNFGIGWEGNINNIFLLMVFNIVFIFLGIITLKRKVQ